MHTRKTSGVHLIGAALAAAGLAGSAAAQAPSGGQAGAAGKAAAAAPAFPPRYTIGRDDLARQGDYVASVALSPDGRRLAVGCSVSRAALGKSEGGASLWDLAARKRIALIPGRFGLDIVALAFSPDGATLAVGDDAGGVVLWDVAAGRAAASIDTNPLDARAGAPGDRYMAVDGLRFRPDARVLFAYPSLSDRIRFANGRIRNLDGRLRGWDVATGKEVEPMATRRGLGMIDLTFAPGGRALVLGYVAVAEDFENETVEQVLWDVAAGRGASLKDPAEQLGGPKLSSDGQFMISLMGPAVAGQDDQGPLLAKGILVVAFAPDRPDVIFRSDIAVKDFTMSPNGRLVACVSAAEPGDNAWLTRGTSIQLVNAATGALLGAFSAADADGVVFSGDSRSFAVSCADHVMVWDVDQVVRPRAGR